MMEGDRLRFVGSHAQGLNSISRGRGGSAAAASASRASKTRRRDIARAAAATDSAGLRAAARAPVSGEPACDLNPVGSMQISSLNGAFPYFRDVVDNCKLNAEILTRFA